MPRFDSQEKSVLQIGAETLPYTVQRSARRRRTLTLSFGHDGLRVLAPRRASLRQIEDLLFRRQGWIRNRLDHLRRFVLPDLVEECVEGAMLPYLGGAYRLTVVAGKPGCLLKEDRLEVSLRTPTPQALRRAVLRWYRAEAEVLMKQRLDLWAARLKLRYRRLVISNPRRLWGSCGPDNTIRINWRIIMAPLELVDCLAAHELCHVVHKNHSARFWRFLASAMPDHAARKQALRALEAGLLPRFRK